MNISVVRSAIVAGTVLVVAAAQAQDAKTNAVRLGLFWPSNSDLKAATSDNWFTFGFDHALDKPLVNLSGTTNSLSIDYFEKSGNRSIPLVLQFHFPGENGFGFFAGAGIAESKFAGDSDTLDYVIDAGFNYNLPVSSTPLFLQGKYIFTGKDNYRGFTFSVGYRF